MSPGRVTLSARAYLPVLSPPFGAFEGAAGDGDVNVYRRHRTDAAGDATRYTAWDDGGLTIEGVHDPVLSPDGTMIAFIGVPVSSNLGALYVVANTPGSTATLLEDDGATWINHPMWSPDSSTIVFTRGGAAGNVYGGTVESIPAAGGAPTVLYTPGGSDLAYRPAYNFDGSRIAFVKAITGNDELWIMDADGSPAASVATLASNYRFDGPMVAWSPFADRLVYDDGALGAVLRVINGNGTGSTVVNPGVTNATVCRVGNQAWIDADTFVFVSNQGDGFLRLYAGDAGGANEAALSLTNGSANQFWMKQPLVYAGRIWFIETASSSNGGRLASFALDGSDYVEELDVNDATLLDWFVGGTGFYYQ